MAHTEHEVFIWTSSKTKPVFSESAVSAKRNSCLTCVWWVIRYTDEWGVTNPEGQIWGKGEAWKQCWAQTMPLMCHRGSSVLAQAVIRAGTGHRCHCQMPKCLNTSGGLGGTCWRKIAAFGRESILTKWEIERDTGSSVHQLKLGGKCL